MFWCKDNKKMGHKKGNVITLSLKVVRIVLTRIICKSQLSIMTCKNQCHTFCPKSGRKSHTFASKKW